MIYDHHKQIRHFRYLCESWKNSNFLIIIVPVDGQSPVDARQFVGSMVIKNSS